MRVEITPIILTFNEQMNIRRTLSKLNWASEVLVVDSFSTDQTLDICAEFCNVRLVQNHFKDPADQCNFALTQDIKTEWVLSMDADYVLSDALVTELQDFYPTEYVNGFRLHFNYLINGKQVRGSLYPPRVSLYRKQFAHYQQDGHTQRVEVTGTIGDLDARAGHDDRKSFKRWLASQKRYAKQEAVKLQETPWGELSVQDKLRRSGLAPLVILPYMLINQRSILDGMAGLKYTSQRLIAECYLQLARLQSLFRRP
jgi:glycosyltransferase involved in cell wall biosynthesis